MKVDGELGFVKPNPPLADIVSDMGALEQEEKLCCKGVVCDPWNVSDFDHSVSDDSLKDFEEPIEALCTKEMDEFCNATNNASKDICVDDGLAVTSLGHILFGHCANGDKESRTREDPVQVDMEIVLEEQVLSKGFDFDLAGEDSDIDDKKLPEESKGNNICSVITDNDEELSSVSYVSTEESKTSTAMADNVEESSIVSNDLIEESKTGNGNASESNIISNKTDNHSNTIAGNAVEPNTVSKKSTEELKIDNLCSVDTESAQNNDFGHFQDIKDGMIRRESSFSIAGPLSGLITYSGPITYSGSCSLRSDSSTTSTRSFAFPVLQAEWSSSPVRMRAADRRKHRSCWRQGLLCCRF